MAIALRNIFAVVLPTLAAGVYFVPFAPDNLRQLLGSSLLILSMYVQGSLSGPGARPAQPAWAERDAGERVSIVMFNLAILTVLGFFASQLIEAFSGPDSAWWQPVIATALVTGGLWNAWRSWSNRNAR